MDQENSNLENEHNRNISHMDCLSICILLKHAIDGKRLLELLGQVMCQCCHPKLENPVYRLQTAHSACHYNADFAELISNELDLMYADTLCHIEMMEAAEIIEKHISTMRETSLSQQAGLAWALLRSDDSSKQNIGNSVVHMMFHCLGKVEYLENHHPQHEALEIKCENLSKALNRKQQQIDDMLDYIYKTRQVDTLAPVGADSQAFRQ